LETNNSNDKNIINKVTRLNRKLLLFIGVTFFYEENILRALFLKNTFALSSGDSESWDICEWSGEYYV